MRNKIINAGKLIFEGTSSDRNLVLTKNLAKIMNRIRAHRSILNERHNSKETFNYKQVAAEISGLYNKERCSREFSNPKNAG